VLGEGATEGDAMRRHVVELILAAWVLVASAILGSIVACLVLP
jgi:hypothetical protein